MHFEGVSQIGIESAIPLRHPQWHAAVDADDHISPWSRVNRWLIWDTSILFLCTVSKIVYWWVEKRGAQNKFSMKAVKGRMGHALFLSIITVIWDISANTPLFAYCTGGPHKVTAAPAWPSCLKLFPWYLFGMPSRRWWGRPRPAPQSANKGGLVYVAHGRETTAQSDTAVAEEPLDVKRQSRCAAEEGGGAAGQGLALKSIRDTLILFLCTVSKIVYRQV